MNVITNEIVEAGYIHDITITEGDRIRSYDFERGSYYVEGVVKKVITEISPEFGYWAFVIDVDVDTLYDEDHSRVGLEVYAPLVTTFDYEGRIQKV